jgi:GNAT superfamily N-acetyltransferase
MRSPSDRDTGADAVFRDADAGDFEAILGLYGQLNPDDDTSPTTALHAVFDSILSREGLRLLVLELDGTVVATTYLIENVVVSESLRGRGVGKTLMANALDAAWEAGCYKVMLLTGSKQESTHAFYRACGFSGDDKAAYVIRPASSSTGAP